MTTPLSKVQSGDPFKFPAEVYNLLIDTLEERLGKLQGGPGDTIPNPPHRTTVLVRNSSGRTLSRYSILGIDGPAFVPTRDLAPTITLPGQDGGLQFKNRIVVVGDRPSPNHDHVVILLESALQDEVASAVIVGLVQVRLLIDPLDPDAIDYKHADIIPNNDHSLKAAKEGRYPIVWKQDPTTAETPIVWSLVLLGGSAATPKLEPPVVGTITEIHKDYLTIQTRLTLPWRTFEVAKIEELRQSTYEGREIDDWLFTYSGTQGDRRTVSTVPPLDPKSEDHEVFPPYQVGDEVIAVEMVTGVETDPPMGPTGVTPDPVPIEYMYLGDPRVWAEVD